MRVSARYKADISLFQKPGESFRVTGIAFEPPLKPEHVQFYKDIEVLENDTMQSVVLRYLDTVHIDGQHLYTLIENES